MGTVRLGFNYWNRNDRRDINISLQSVRKHYKLLSDEDVTALESFYR